MQEHAVEALQQGVMQVARDAGALGNTRVQGSLEIPSDLPQAQQIECPEKSSNSHKTERAEPGGLPVGRRNREVERCTLLVPHAAVVARDDAEAILAGRKVIVEGLTAVADVLPSSIVTFELVAEPHLLGGDEAESGVIDFKITQPRRQAQRY